MPSVVAGLVVAVLSVLALPSAAAGETLRADIDVVSLTPDKTTVLSGETVTYTAVVRNNGPADVTCENCLVIFTLTGSTTHSNVSLKSTVGSCENQQCRMKMAAGTEATITIVDTVSGQPGPAHRKVQASPTSGIDPSIVDDPPNGSLPGPDVDPNEDFKESTIQIGTPGPPPPPPPPPPDTTPGAISNLAVAATIDRSKNAGPTFDISKPTWIRFEFVRYTPGLRKGASTKCTTSYTAAQRTNLLQRRGRAYRRCYKNPTTVGWWFEQRIILIKHRFDIDDRLVYPDNDNPSGQGKVTPVALGYYRLKLTPFTATSPPNYGATKTTSIFRVIE